MTEKKMLYRDPDNGMIAGVAAGLSDYFEIDVTVVRLLWIFTVIFAGGGIIAYIIMALVVEPKEKVMKRMERKKEKNKKNKDPLYDADDPFAKYDR